jgi:peptidoglycan/LPS O-acetylase OafA/YrhL
MNDHGRLQFIDSFRGIAAIMVVLYHLTAALPEASLSRFSLFFKEVFQFGYVGVDIFFVISGFVICMSLDRCRERGTGFQNFFIARIIRLTPAYWMLIFIVTLKLLVVAMLGKGIEQSDFDLWQLVANLLYVQGLTGHADLVPVFWTLCYEMQYYLFFGFLYLLCVDKKNTTAGTVFFGFVFLLSLASMYSFFIQNIFWQGLMLTYFHFFIMGVVTYLAVTKRVNVRFFYLFGGAFLLFYIFSDRHAVRIVALLFAAFIYIVIVNKLDVKWLSGRFLLHMGMISYSLYLVHPVFGWKVFSVLGNKLQAFHADVAFWGALGAGLVACYIVSYLFYRMIEKPSIRWSKAYGAKPEAVGGLTKGQREERIDSVNEQLVGLTSQPEAR